jgi:TolA-binding protein
MELRVRKERRVTGWVPPLAALLVLVMLAMAVLAGCKYHAAGSAAKPAGSDAEPATATQSQAERTHEMEEKARQMNEKATEIQNSQGTEQEKIDAVNKLEQDRQELNRTGGDGSTPPASPPP